jgi:hypothetical protein
MDLSQPVPLTGLPALRLTLGYFALTGLGRLSVLLGDYYTALRTFSFFDLKEKKIASAPSLVVSPYPALYARIPSCLASLFFHVAFCYLMLGRFVDALRLLVVIRNFYTRSKYGQHRPFGAGAAAAPGGDSAYPAPTTAFVPNIQGVAHQSDALLKRCDQMVVLLGLCHALCPLTIDESLVALVCDRQADRYQRLRAGDLATFEEAFHYAAPKFVAASRLAPSSSSSSASSSSVAAPPIPAPGAPQLSEAARTQLALFLSIIQHRLMHLYLRSIFHCCLSFSISHITSVLSSPLYAAAPSSSSSSPPSSASSPFAAQTAHFASQLADKPLREKKRLVEEWLFSFRASFLYSTHSDPSSSQLAEAVHRRRGDIDFVVAEDLLGEPAGDPDNVTIAVREGRTVRHCFDYFFKQMKRCSEIRSNVGKLLAD